MLFIGVVPTKKTLHFVGFFNVSLIHEINKKLFSTNKQFLIVTYYLYCIITLNKLFFI